MSETTKALFKDALYQVLDNKVFRLLVILVAFLVLPTFLIAAKPDQLEVLFGKYKFDYLKIFEWSRILKPSNPADYPAAVIQFVQTLLVDNIAGTFGLIFAVAATAFFVPRMVEKGAADTIFSKPVSRWTLIFSRYLAGILFVGILASVLVGGMYLGFLVNSGYTDTGFLWSIPVVIYKYAVLHAFSLLIAVWTRSSIAAILTTLMFFAFNGCVQGGWQLKEIVESRQGIERDAGEKPVSDDSKSVLDALVIALDALHYTLPKTSDTAVISKVLRKELSPAASEFKDETSKLEVKRAPTGFTLQPAGSVELPAIASWKQDNGNGRITLERWNNREHKRIDARNKLDADLAARGIKDVKKDKLVILGASTDVRSWQESRDGGNVDRETRFFIGRGYWFTLEYELPARWTEDREHAHALREFEMSFEQQGEASFNIEAYFEQHASWTGELKYNLTFSIASTLAWIALVLGIACWRLSRIDF